jgi:hypothetical protein
MPCQRLRSVTSAGPMASNTRWLITRGRQCSTPSSDAGYRQQASGPGGTGRARGVGCGSRVSSRGRFCPSWLLSLKPDRMHLLSGLRPGAVVEPRVPRAGDKANRRLLTSPRPSGRESPPAGPPAHQTAKRDIGPLDHQQTIIKIPPAEPSTHPDTSAPSSSGSDPQRGRRLRRCAAKQPRACRRTPSVTRAEPLLTRPNPMVDNLHYVK